MKGILLLGVLIILSNSVHADSTYFYAGSQQIAQKNEMGIKLVHIDVLGTNIDTKTLPFGQVIYENSRFGFTGKELDNSELHYYNARFYNSNMGRFISSDPIKRNQAYIYVYNNPLILGDPSGMNPAVAQAQIQAARAMRTYFEMNDFTESINYQRGKYDTNIFPRDPAWFNKEMGTIKEAGMTAANYGGDFVPIAGDIKGIGEAITGKDIQGNKLGPIERGLCFLCLSEIKSGSRLAKVTKIFDPITTYIRKANRVFDEASGTGLFKIGTTQVREGKDVVDVAVYAEVRFKRMLDGGEVVWETKVTNKRVLVQDLRRNDPLLGPEKVSKYGDSKAVENVLSEKLLENHPYDIADLKVTSYADLKAKQTWTRTE